MIKMDKEQTTKIPPPNATKKEKEQYEEKLQKIEKYKETHLNIKQPNEPLVDGGDIFLVGDYSNKEHILTLYDRVEEEGFIKKKSKKFILDNITIKKEIVEEILTLKPKIYDNKKEVHKYLIKAYNKLRGSFEAYVDQQQEDEKPDENKINTSLYINEEKNIIAEQIYTEEQIYQFCVYNTKTKKITYENEILDGEKTYLPIIDEEVEKKAVLLPSKAEEYKTDDELNNDIKTFCIKWIDIPEDVLQFNIWNLKRSWVYERFHTLNYSRALGDTGYGKTRFLDVFGSLHYKPIATSGASTAAPIFRVIDKWRGTLIMDESDLKYSHSG